MDSDSVADTHFERGVRTDQEEQERSCFYCLEGWVFLGSLNHDGEVVIEPIRCRRCKGTGRLRS